MSSREPSVNPGAITQPLFVLLWVPEFGSITVVTSMILLSSSLNGEFLEVRLSLFLSLYPQDPAQSVTRSRY